MMAEFRKLGPGGRVSPCFMLIEAVVRRQWIGQKLASQVFLTAPDSLTSVAS
jgi:hypothetical protein